MGIYDCNWVAMAVAHNGFPVLGLAISGGDL